MELYYETQIKTFSEEEKKFVKRWYLVKAESFTEAEANITEYLGKKDINDFEVLAIKKNVYEVFLYRTEDQKVKFYEAKVRAKFAGESDIVYKLLVAGLNLEDSTEFVKEFIVDNNATPTVLSIKQRNISDLAFVKKCESGRNVVIGFDEQKRIELRIEVKERIESEHNVTISVVNDGVKD